MHRTCEIFSSFPHSYATTNAASDIATNDFSTDCNATNDATNGIANGTTTMPPTVSPQPSACEQACIAANMSDLNALGAIIDQGEDICNCECDPSTEEGVIHVAVRSGCNLCVLIIISSPSSCSRNTRDDDGNTGLHLAAKLCLPDMTKTFVDMGFSVNTENNKYNTPLCVASTQDNLSCSEVIEPLIDGGADASHVCSDGKTPCEGCVNNIVCVVLGAAIGATCG